MIPITSKGRALRKGLKTVDQDDTAPAAEEDDNDDVVVVVVDAIVAIVAYDLPLTIPLEITKEAAPTSMSP